MMRGLSEVLFDAEPYLCGVFLAQLFLVGAVVYLDGSPSASITTSASPSS